MIRAADIEDRGLENGTWQLLIGTVGGDAPDLACFYRGEEVTGSTLTRSDDVWLISVNCPDTILSDGTHTLVLRDRTTGETVATTCIVAGRALDRDLASEVALLRAELDLLKRTFRNRWAD